MTGFGKFMRMCGAVTENRKIRVLHPLSLIWFVVMLVVGLFWIGLRGLIEDTPDFVRDDLVWWSDKNK